jgi:hypothetical protein
VPIHNRTSCVTKAAALLVRKHGSPDAALLALRPAFTRLQEASIESDRRTPWALLERASRRYGFWLDVRLGLLSMDRGVRRHG